MVLMDIRYVSFFAVFVSVVTEANRGLLQATERLKGFIAPVTPPQGRLLRRHDWTL